jgi:AcrR family transcriptional regulator
VNVVAPPLNDRVVAILDAACRVVVREGAHGLRMASVASEAGVSKALVHYYFTTRQDLLRSAFVYSEEQWYVLVTDELAAIETGAGRVERFLLVGVDPEPGYRDNRALWSEVWSSLRFDDDLRPSVDRYYRAWVDRLVALLEEAVADGSVPPTVDPSEAAWRLAAIADGVDSMLDLGLVDRARARELVLGGLRRELA